MNTPEKTTDTIIEQSSARIYSDLVSMLDMGEHDVMSKGLHTGRWGALFYLFYYERYHGAPNDSALKYLQALYEDIDAGFGRDFTFCTGLTGPFWLLHHLHKHDFIDVDVNDIASDFLSVAIEQSSCFLANRDFDFLHGSAGICNLLTGFADRKDVREHLNFFVDCLMSFAAKSETGIRFPFFYYHTEPASRPGTDAFSLAHGTCALQLILMKIHAAGIARANCRHLIVQSMAFILKHENDPREGRSLFPAYLDGKSAHSRVSWCYGDLNVATALWQCGKYFNFPSWTDKALAIFKYNAGRIAAELSGTIDVCLCHGSAGNAAMYWRMWHETGEPLFQDCANVWYDITLKTLRFPSVPDVAGVLVYQGRDDAWQHNWTLLEGSAGVGLALLSRQLDMPLPWDEFLLLS